jgi:hypothetical protein
MAKGSACSLWVSLFHYTLLVITGWVWFAFNDINAEENIPTPPTTASPTIPSVSTSESQDNKTHDELGRYMHYQNNKDSYVMLPKDSNQSAPSSNNDGEVKTFDKVNLKELEVPECKDVPIYFEACRPAMCIEKSMLGTVYRNIGGLGTNADKKEVCKYIERSQNFGSVSCQFSRENLQHIDNVLKNYSLSYPLAPGQITKEEEEARARILEKDCQIITEAEAQQVMVDKKIDQELVLVEGNTTQVEEGKITSGASNPEKVENIPEGGEQASQVDQAITSITPERMWNDISLMFLPEDADRLEKATLITAADAQNSEKQRESSSLLTTQTMNAGSFYLNSILYIRPDLWSVRVNNIKLTSQVFNPNLEVIEISSNRVKFRWYVPNLKALSPNWELKVKKVEDGSYSAVGSDIIIKEEVGAQGQIIEFALMPNQSFEISSMSIIEGKILR